MLPADPLVLLATGKSVWRARSASACASNLIIITQLEAVGREESNGTHVPCGIAARYSTCRHIRMTQGMGASGICCLLAAGHWSRRLRASRAPLLCCLPQPLFALARYCNMSHAAMPIVHPSTLPTASWPCGPRPPWPSPSSPAACRTPPAGPAPPRGGSCCGCLCRAPATAW
jgi:hypothetical protein